MNPTPHRARHTPAALLAVLAASVVALGLTAVPAAAHGGDGALEVVSNMRATGDDVVLIVALTYVNDGDPVVDATVTAVVGDGAAVAFEGGEAAGQYQGTVAAPEGATIRVTSVEPTVTLDVAAPAGAETTTTEATTTSTTEATTTTAAPTTAEATTTTTPSTDVIVEDDDDGLSSGALVAIGAGVVVVAGLGIWAALNLGKNSDDEVDDGVDGPAGPPASGSPPPGDPAG